MIQRIKNMSSGSNPSGADRERPLTGRLALVTGAAGSLGSSIAVELARCGADVVVHHLDTPEAAEEVAATIRAIGRKAYVVHADVSDEDQVNAVVATIEANIGPISILVNNAGYMDERPFLDTPLAIWKRTLDVDLTGVFLVSRAVVAHMVERRSGNVVNLASQLAFKGGESVAPYCAAKAGVVGLTRAMARELGPDVHVTAVAPGPLETAMTAPFADADWLHKRTNSLIMNRLGQPTEVAPIVAFLASDAAVLLHGQVLHANGGGVMF
jgi:3-oxoacyl-[acyl-carrier protein] reductase